MISCCRLVVEREQSAASLAAAVGVSRVCRSCRAARRTVSGCGGGQIEQLCQQKVLLWARCQQSDGGGALFRGECVIQSCVAGVVSDVLDEGQCIGLILPCDGETAATAAESLIDCGEQQQERLVFGV